LAGQPKHGPPQQAGGLRRSEAGAIIEGLAAKDHQVSVTDFLNGCRQDACCTLRIEVAERRVGDQDGLVGTHGQGVFERFFGCFWANAQCDNGSALGFFLLQCALNGVLVKGVDDQGRIPPGDLPIFGFDFGFGVGHLFDTGDDFQGSSFVQAKFLEYE